MHTVTTSPIAHMLASSFTSCFNLDVRQDGAIRRTLRERKVGTEVGSGSLDRGREHLERFTNRLMQPVLSWSAFQVFFHRAQKISDDLGRFCDMVF